jgi:lipopolysaccharide transport system permease protein
VMFWLVPVFYSFEMIPQHFRLLYLFNPIAAVVVAGRDVLLHAKPPAPSLLAPLVIVSVLCFVLGLAVFGQLERDLADQL